MKETKKDMENIQRNLEYFLEQELKNSVGTSSREYESTVSEGLQETVSEEEMPWEDSDFEASEDAEDKGSLSEEIRQSGRKESSGKRGILGRKTGLPKKRKAKKKKAEKSNKRQTKKEPAGDKRAVRKERVRTERKRGRDETLSKKKQSGKARYEEEEEERTSGFLKFLVTLICLFVLLGIAWYVAISGIYGKMEYSREGQLAEESMTDKGVVNILLIGTDARSSEEAGRSDAMILLSVSSKTKTVHMTSLLRDMYVEIPGHDGNRLNAAYAYGGPELLLETVSLNFGIDVNRYVVVDFQTFANLVDAVGGVDIELTNEEVAWVNAYLNEYNMLRNMPLETDYLDTSLSGMLHLNGPQALAYSRNRYIGSDFGRTERQRKVLGAVADNIGSAIVQNPMELIDGVFSELTTNLTKGECLRLSLMSSKLLTYEIVQASIPLAGTYSDASIRGMAVLEVDFEKNKDYIRSEIYGK